MQRRELYTASGFIGGSAKSGYILSHMARGTFDIRKMKTEPSEDIKKRFPAPVAPIATKKTKQPIKDDIEDDYDVVSQKLQQLIFITPTDKIVKALAKCGYKGRINPNKMLMVMQIMQNMNTISKLKELIHELQK